MPAVSWLIAPCWCKTFFVPVPQRLILEGLTYSCGLRSCCDPEGDEPIVSDYVISQSCTVPHNVDRWMAQRGVPEPRRARTRVTALKPNPRGQTVAFRREQVYDLWCQKKRYVDIAVTLEVPAHVVYSDIQWLRKKGKLRA